MTGISFRDVHGIADELGVDVQTVRRWIQSGRLRAFKPGKEYRVREADLEEFLAAREVRPKAAASPEQQLSFNGLLEERRIALLRALRDDLQAAALGMGRWLGLESYTSIEGYEAAPETVLSLWTGISNACEDDALARHAVWNVLLETPAGEAEGEEQTLLSGARKYLEEYKAATRALREKLDSEWQELQQQKPDADVVNIATKRRAG